MDLIVKNIKEISENYILVNFVKPEKLHFKIGQWIEIKFPIEEFPIANVFSIASSPSETDLLVLYKRGLSKYKKLLEDLKIGDRLILTNQGGKFAFNQNNNCIFIAGGVGIAPFRGTIKYLLDNKINIHMILIHLNAYQYFPFRDEFENWKINYSNFKPFFIKTDGHKISTMNRLHAILHSTNILSKSVFYLAGPTELVANCHTLFNNMGIEKRLIRSEGFEGYLSNEALSHNKNEIGPVAQR